MPAIREGQEILGWFFGQTEDDVVFELNYDTGAAVTALPRVFAAPVGSDATSPDRCKLEVLAGTLEQWDASMRKYEIQEKRERIEIQTAQRREDDCA